LDVAVLLYWTDGSRLNDGKVGAPAVSKHRDSRRAVRSHLDTVGMEVYDPEH
jgi:hypothetical protein